MLSELIELDVNINIHTHLLLSQTVEPFRGFLEVEDDVSVVWYNPLMK